MLDLNDGYFTPEAPGARVAAREPRWECSGLRIMQSVLAGSDDLPVGEHETMPVSRAGLWEFGGG